MPRENTSEPVSSQPNALSVFDSRAGAHAASATFLLGQVMFLVAIAIAFAAAGTYIGRDLSYGTAQILSFGALGMIVVQMFVPALREGPVGMAWLFAFGLALGLGLGPVIAHYATFDQSALYEAAGGTALTVGIMGSYGFATSRDLIRWMRPLFWAMLAVFAIALVMVLVGSGNNLVLNIAIYLIFAAYLAIYFQIIRRQATERDVVWIATGVFISVINVFLTLLRIFGNGR